MTIRVAINGFGRIGRNVLRAHYEYAKQHDVEIVAINSPGDLAVNAHLLKYDTVHGRFTTPVETDGKDMIVGGDRIHVFKTRDPRELPWADLGVDLVMECTGAFNSKEASMVHIESGAKKVLLSALARPRTRRWSTALIRMCLRPRISWCRTPPARPTVWRRSSSPCRTKLASSTV